MAYGGFTLFTAGSLPLSFYIYGTAEGVTAGLDLEAPIGNSQADRRPASTPGNQTTILVEPTVTDADVDAIVRSATAPSLFAPTSWASMITPPAFEAADVGFGLEPLLNAALLPYEAEYFYPLTFEPQLAAMEPYGWGTSVYDQVQASLRPSLAEQAFGFTKNFQIEYTREEIELEAANRRRQFARALGEAFVGSVTDFTNDLYDRDPIQEIINNPAFIALSFYSPAGAARGAIQVTSRGVAITAETLARQGTSRLAGNFMGLAGKSVDEIVSRVPSTWTMVRQRSGQGIRFLDDLGFERIRIHAPTLNAPAGSNSAAGWTLRVQSRAKFPQNIKYYDDAGRIVPRHANEGHIPIYGNPNAPR